MNDREPLRLICYTFLTNILRDYKMKVEAGKRVKVGNHWKETNLSILIFSLYQHYFSEPSINCICYSQSFFIRLSTQVVKMLVAVVVIFVMCWTPVLTLRFWEAASKIFTKVPATSPTKFTVNMWLAFLSYINSCANVFIYYLTSE